MNNPDAKHSDLAADIISAAIEVHRAFGPGLLESVYEKCLHHELLLRGHRVKQQTQVQIRYKDKVFEETLRCDLLVDDLVLIELKTVETVQPIHKAQVLSHLKLLRLPVGLLINFNTTKLTDGVHRVSL